MRLNRNTLFILLGAIVVIVVAVVLINMPEEAAPETISDDTSGDLFPEATPETVTSLSVTDRDGLSINLQRGEGEEALWQIVDSTDTVDTERVDTAVNNLAALSYSERYETEDASQYGFGDDETPAVITFLADGTEYTLTVGRQNPSGNRYYTRLIDDESIYLVNSSTLDTILNLASQQPIVVPPTPTPVPVLNAPGIVFAGFSAPDMQRFTVTDNDNNESLVLVRNDEGLWTILDDERAIDQSSVEVLLSVFGFVEAVDAIEGADLEALGLDEPAFTIEATDSSGKTFTIRLGDTDPSGTRTYALIDDYETVAVLQADALSSIINWLEEPPLAPEPTPSADEADTDVTEETSGETTSEATEETPEEPTEEPTTTE